MEAAARASGHVRADERIAKSTQSPFFADGFLRRWLSTLISASNTQAFIDFMTGADLPLFERASTDVPVGAETAEMLASRKSLLEQRRTGAFANFCRDRYVLNVYNEPCERMPDGVDPGTLAVHYSISCTPLTGPTTQMIRV